MLEAHFLSRAERLAPCAGALAKDAGNMDNGDMNQNSSVSCAGRMSSFFRDECIAFFAAWMAALVICGAEITVIAGYGSGYDAFFIVFAVLVLALWTLLFVLSLRQVRGLYSRKSLFGIAVFLLIIAFFLLQARSGIDFDGERLSLDPLREVAEGTGWTDDLYFSSLASSYAYYGKVSPLLNGVNAIRYHAAAYCFLSLFTKFFNVPAFLVFRYTYPVLFLPLYIGMLVSCAAAAKRRFCGGKQLSFYDIVAVGACMAGVLPAAMLKPARIWKYVLPDSASCCASIILALLYLRLILEQDPARMSKLRANLLLYVVTPIAILACGMTKISTGFLLAGGACWYLFRKNAKSLRYWISMGLFIAAFFLLYYYVMGSSASMLRGNSPIVITNDGTRVQGGNFGLFCFVHDYVAAGCGFAHYAILGFFAFAVLVCTVDFRKISLRHIFAEPQYIVQELLVVIYLLGVLPGVFMRIVGGSAMCFSFAQEIPALIAFVGFGIPERIVSCFRERSRMPAVYGALAAMLIVMAGNAHVGGVLKGIAFQRIHGSSVKSEHFVADVKAQLKSGRPVAALASVWRTFWARSCYADGTLYQNILAVNRLTAGQQQDWAMYIDSDAELWATYPFDGRFPVRVYPAMTGLPLLDVLYNKGVPGQGVFVYNSGDQLYRENQSFYDGEAFCDKRTFPEVVENARALGYRHLIRMHGTTFDVIDL